MAAPSGRARAQVGLPEPDWVRVSRSNQADDQPTPALEPHHIPLVDWLWLSVATLLSLALRIPFFRIPMVADEGGYAYATRGWVNGTGELYGDLWISRPQGIFFVYAGIFDLFGTGTTAFRFAAWIAVALTLIAVWGFARMCTTPLAANLAALVFAVASSLPNLEGYTANAEMFMGLPAALAALWLLRVRRTGWSRWQLAGIGLMIGTAIGLKPSAAVMIPVALLFIVMIDGGSPARVLVPRMLWLGSGIGAVGAGLLLHGWTLGWSDFFYATISYRLSAQSAATVGLQHNLEAMGSLAWRASALIGLVALLFALRYRVDITSAFQAFLGLRRTFARRRPRWNRSGWNRAGGPGFLARPRNDGKLLLRLWLIGTLAGASIGGDWWSHYLIQMIAPLSIWMGWTIATVWPTLASPARPVLAMTIVGLLVAPFWVLIHGSPVNMAQAMFSHPGYPAQDRVAAYLRDQTEPGTSIYVAFDQASIYYLADRPPAYRHLYDQELRGIPSSYSDLISIIQSDDRPEYIVSTRQPGPFADASRAFWQEVGQYYDLVDTIEGVPIYQDKDSILPGD